MVPGGMIENTRTWEGQVWLFNFLLKGNAVFSKPEILNEAPTARNWSSKGGLPYLGA